MIPVSGTEYRQYFVVSGSIGYWMTLKQYSHVILAKSCKHNTQ